MSIKCEDCETKATHQCSYCGTYYCEECTDFRYGECDCNSPPIITISEYKKLVNKRKKQRGK